MYNLVESSKRQMLFYCNITKQVVQCKVLYLHSKDAEMLVQVLVGTLTVLTEVFQGFLHSVQANVGTVFQVGHDHFFPNPYLFTILQSFHH